MSGNMAPYMTSYFDDATKSGPQTIFSMTLTFTVLGNFPGTYIMKNKILGPKMIILIGSTSCICALAVCSNFKKFSYFEYSYPLLLGFGCGFMT